MARLWSKNGGAPQELPKVDYTAAGHARTDLANNPASLAELGWVLVSCPPKISRMQAQLELEARGLYAAVDAQIMASGDNNLKIYWTSATDFERYHVQVLTFAALLGLDESGADDFFTSAAQRR